MPENTVSYRRPPPAEWQAAETEAHAIAGSATYQDLASSTMSQMTEYVTEFDNETLEATAYYGFGLVMCGFAQELQKPVARQSVTLHAAAQLAKTIHRNHRTAGTAQLRISDINPHGMYRPFIRLAQEASTTLDTPSRLLTETLSATLLTRRLNGIASVSIDSYCTKRLRSGELTAEIVGINAVSGIAGVLRQCLRLIADRKGINPSDPVLDIATSAELKSLDIQKLSLQCGLLRLDEFTGELLSRLIRDDEGRMWFDRAALPTAPAPLPTSDDAVLKFLHEERLTCPAVQVEGLIPAFTKIVPQIVTDAQRLLRMPIKRFVIPPL